MVLVQNKSTRGAQHIHMSAFGLYCWCMLTVLCVVLSLVLLFLDLFLERYASESAPSVIIQLKAGMGNQMFQYAAGLGMAHAHPEYRVCVSGLGDHFQLAHANSALDLHIQVLNASGLVACRELGGVFRWLQNNIVNDLELRLAWLIEFSPPHSTYVPIPVPLQKLVLVSGYMQSFKYFRHVPHPFYRPKQLDAARLWLSQRELTSVVHVRRGDKLWDSSPVVPVAYYQKALHAIGNPRVAVCTDDVEWVRAQPVFENATISIRHDPGFDLALLAAATEYVVIGIGTFGWWGAYLSTAKRKYFYQIMFQGELLLGYEEADYIPYNESGQGEWIAMV